MSGILGSLAPFCGGYTLSKIKGPSKILFVDALWILLDEDFPVYGA